MAWRLAMVKISEVIVDEIINGLDPKFKEYYEQNKNRSKYFGGSFTELVTDIMQEDIAPKDSQSLARLRTQKLKSRSNKRKRLYKRCSDDIDMKAWKADNIDFFAIDLVLIYDSLVSSQRETMYGNKSLDELLLERLNAVKIWADDSASTMIEFPGKQKLTAHAALANLTMDLTIAILNFIKDKYNYDLRSQLIPYLEDLSDKPVFSVTSERIPVNPKGPTKYTLMADPISQVKLVAVYDGTGDNTFTTLFDIKDNDIVSFFLMKAVNSPMSVNPLMIEESELVKYVYRGSDRHLSKKDYDIVRAHVHKLSHTVLDKYEQDNWAGKIELIGTVLYKTLNGRSYMEYYPSDYLKQQVELGLFMQLPMKIRDMLDDTAAKLLYSNLMLQRYNAYQTIRSGNIQNNTYVCEYKFEDFLRFINFGPGSTKDIHIAIEHALDDYVRIEKIIKSYQFHRITNSYTIEFYPLSQSEINDFAEELGHDRAKEISDNIISQLLPMDEIQREE